MHLGFCCRQVFHLFLMYLLPMKMMILCWLCFWQQWWWWWLFYKWLQLFWKYAAGQSTMNMTAKLKRFPTVQNQSRSREDNDIDPVFASLVAKTIASPTHGSWIQCSTVFWGKFPHEDLRSGLKFKMHTQLSIERNLPQTRMLRKGNYDSVKSENWFLLPSKTWLEKRAKQF